MKIIEDQTRKDGFDCIKFKYRTNSEKNYLNIINDIGYYSDVGKRKKKKSQLFSLDIRSGCVVKEVVLHQLVHALMFHHEQSRPVEMNIFKYLRITSTQVNYMLSFIKTLKVFRN